MNNVRDRSKLPATRKAAQRKKARQNQPSRRTGWRQPVGVTADIAPRHPVRMRNDDPARECETEIVKSGRPTVSTVERLANISPSRHDPPDQNTDTGNVNTE
jgi:hypothetical protein